MIMTSALLLSKKTIFYLSVAASLVALAGAYFAEALGYSPCILCIYQRIPYGFILVFSILGFLFKNHKRASRILLSCIILAFICAVSLASYHVLVEHHIIEETSYCGGSPELSDDPAEAMKQLMEKPAKSCAYPEIIVLSLSMAEWNLCFSLIVTIIIIYLRLTDATGR